MKYYKSVYTGKIIRETSLKVFEDVYGTDAIPRSLISAGMLIEIDKEPTVLDCLTYGNRGLAIQRYREIHECDYAEAKKVVDAIEGDLRRLHNSKKYQKRVVSKDSASANNYYSSVISPNEPSMEHLGGGGGDITKFNKET